MKKTKSLRVEVGMLALTLVTSCFVSGTFAKYVTKATGDGTDLARVAKWGVEINAGAGDLFKKVYAKDAEGELTDGKTNLAITNTVEADVKVVAPGTKNDNGGFFSLKGQPEVAVNVKIEMTGKDGGAITDVVLPAGTYKDYTGTATEFTIAEGDDYHPVVFTLKDGATTLKTGTLADIQTYLNGFNKDYAPGTDLSKIFGNDGTGVYTLAWAWEYGKFDEDTGHDQADTYLGQLIADPTNTEVPTGVTVSTAFDFVINITVTQID